MALGPFSSGPGPTRVIGVSSGKGGVGKSSVTVNVAVALAGAGHSVAVLDADVYGFSIPAMLGLAGTPATGGGLTMSDGKVQPPTAFGVRVMSMGFFATEDQPVIWRGPMLHKALEQFLADVDWGALISCWWTCLPVPGMWPCRCPSTCRPRRSMSLRLPRLRRRGWRSGAPTWHASSTFRCAA